MPRFGDDDLTGAAAEAPLVLRGGDSLLHDRARLQAMLALQAPGAPEDSPPVFSFKRRRDVPIAWKEVVGEVTPGRLASIRAMRDWLERSWGIGSAPDTPALIALVARNPEEKHLQMIGDLDVANQAAIPYRAEPSPVFLPVVAGADGKPAREAREIAAGIVVRHRTSGRRYLVRPLPGMTVAIDDFLDADRYRKVWDRIEAFELVYATAEEAQTLVTEFEEIDLRPAYVRRRFKELDIALQVARMAEPGVAPPAGPGPVVIPEGASLEEVEAITRQVLRLRLASFDIEQALDRLVATAAELGYRLALTSEEVQGPDKKPLYKLVRGELYRMVERTVRWTTTEERLVVELGWAFIFPMLRTRVERRPVAHEKAMQVPEKVDTSSDLLAHWQADLRKRSPDAEIFVFDRSAAGFVAAAGPSLREVMERCDLDEAFRRRCVVVLPVHETSLTGARALVRYDAFLRPLPGILPTIMPRLSIEESLSYRTAWQGTQIGELVASVNLAPGERRAVHIVKHFETETTISRETGSVFELEEKESIDLSEEMEREFSRESSESSSLQLSASVSGGTAFVTGSASATSGVETSLAEFAKSTAKVAKKASRSVSRRNRQEVRTSSTSRTTVSTTDDTLAEVENINEGRTLNLMFYRLYNVMKGGLYLDELGFQLVPGVELIAGSGVYESVHLGLGDLPRVVEAMRRTPLPFDLDADGLDRLTAQITRSIDTLVDEDYGVAADDGETGHSVGVLHLPAGRLAARGDAGPAELVGELRGRLLAGGLRLDTGKRIEPIDLLVASPALYLDAMVGERPSTEPYSERMREEEIKVRSAEAYMRESEGLLQRARASQIARDTWRSEELALTGLHRDRRTLMGLSLQLSRPLPEGDWRLVVDRRERLRLDRAAGRDELQLGWQDPQDWLADDDLLLTTELVDRRSGRVVAFLPGLPGRG